MNGQKVREFEARYTRKGSKTVLSLLNGGSITIKEGDVLTISEDEYGNFYAYDADGRECFVGDGWEEI